MHNLIKRNGGDEYRWSSDAIQLIRDATEGHVADIFSRSMTFAEHGKRKGVDLRDMKLARRYEEAKRTAEEDQTSLETSI